MIIYFFVFTCKSLWGLIVRINHVTNVNSYDSSCNAYNARTSAIRAGKIYIYVHYIIYLKYNNIPVPSTAYARIYYYNTRSIRPLHHWRGTHGREKNPFRRGAHPVLRVCFSVPIDAGTAVDFTDDLCE